jgi:hypothetical protein
VNRVVLLESGSGIAIDIALGGLPFEAEMVARATREELAPGSFARTVSAEDLIVLKAFADRDRDWIDIAPGWRHDRERNWTGKPCLRG